jgi:translation initiation factor 3 subunit F
VELIAGAKNTESRTAPVMTDIGALEKAVEDVLGMLERVSTYVNSVLVRFGISWVAQDS